MTALHTGLVEAYAKVLVKASIGILETDSQLVLRIVASLGPLILGLLLEGFPSAEHLGKYVGAEASLKGVSLRRPVRVPELVKVLALLGI